MYRTCLKTNEKFNQSYLQWTTTQNKNVQSENESIAITIDSSTTYQTILGFGCAFTDAVSYNLGLIPQTYSDSIISDIIQSYYNVTNGIGYTLARVPMASCDFSLYSYNYAPVEDDFDLNHFNLTIQDTQPNYGKIALLNMAKQSVSQSCISANSNTNEKINIYINSKKTINNNREIGKKQDNFEDNSQLNVDSCELKLFGTPWTAPPWFKVLYNKDEGNSTGYIGGTLNPERKYWSTWASYFIKFLKEYKAIGNLTFFAVTPQNEPHSPSPWESMVWDVKELTEFITDYLGPKLESYDSNINIWVHDGQKGVLPYDIREMFEYTSNTSNLDAIRYIKGVAFHWYVFPPPIEGCPNDLCNGAFEQVGDLYEYMQNNVSSMNSNNNNYAPYILGTEATSGFSNIESPPNRGVSLGNWHRGEQYGEDIIGDLNNGAVGWNDWNFVLNMEGGPNHVNNTCDAPIVIDHEKEIYYKQPMYYYLAHIVRYIRPNMVRIGMTIDVDIDIDNDRVGKNEDIWSVVFEDIDLKQTVMIVMNRNKNVNYHLVIKDERFGTTNVELMTNSIQTLIWK